MVRFLISNCPDNRLY